MSNRGSRGSRRGRERILENQVSGDGFENFLAKMGAKAENLLSAGNYSFDLLTQNRLKLEAMYRSSWVTGIAIDAKAEDMIRSGIDITSSIEPDQIQEMLSALSSMGIWSSLSDSIKWGRLYGGSIAVLDIDGQEPSSPFKVQTVGKGQFRGLKVYDRWQLQPDTNHLVESGIHEGLPAYYTVISNIGTGQFDNVTYHHSRVIRFIGIKLPRWQEITEQMWGESVIERPYDRILTFDTVTMGSANLVQKAYLRTVKIDNLRGILGAGGKPQENLVKQFEYMRLLQNAEGVTLLDRKDEFDTTSYTFAGLSDMVLQYAQQLAGAFGIPLVRFFGQSPAGLNSTGESDLRIYYDGILAEQNSSGLRDGMHKIIQVLYASMFGSPPPKELDFTFTPLWQTTNQEKSDISSAITGQMVAAYEAGIISQSVAMQELRQSSGITGIYTNITDKQIDEAEKREELTPPPQAPGEEQVEEFLGGGEGDEDRLEKSFDSSSAFSRLKRWMKRG